MFRINIIMQTQHSVKVRNSQFGHLHQYYLVVVISDQTDKD